MKTSILTRALLGALALSVLPASALAQSARVSPVTALQSGAAAAKTRSICRGTTGTVTLRSAGSVGAPNLITFGTDGRLWFSDNALDAIKATTTAGAVTAYPLSPGSSPGDLVPGADGRVWFTQLNANKVGAITSAGAITDYAIAGQPSIPFGITLGADGNVWFTELLSNKVAKITTAGALTEFALPPPNGLPSYITVGLDGKLWISAGAATAIYQVTTAGVVTAFPLPVGLDNPGQLTVGFDGNVWFTTSTGVATISPSGVINAIPIAAASALSDISVGPDGNVWATDPNTDTIFRIKTNGTVTAFPVPAGTSPTGITFAPFLSCDALSLWFTGVGNNTIGSLRAVTVN